MSMSSAAAIRLQVEAALASRIPSALSVAPRVVRPVVSTGIPSVDELLGGGLPAGAISEIVGTDCSGRTSFTLSFLARMTKAGKVCAWIDVSNALQPESVAAAGGELSRVLWVRCGVMGTSSAQVAPQQRFALPEKYLVPPPIKRQNLSSTAWYRPCRRTVRKGTTTVTSVTVASSLTRVW